MKNIFIAKKLNIGDIAHTSDSVAEQLINSRSVKIDQVLTIETPFAQHKAKIVFFDRKTVELEILSTEELSREYTGNVLAVIQAVSGDRKFEYFLEKVTEVGISEIYPVYTEYSLISLAKARSSQSNWSSVVTKAIEQSRTKFPTRLNKLFELSDASLKQIIAQSNSRKPQRPLLKVVLSTDVAEMKPFAEVVSKFANSKNRTFDLLVAVGPEKGWHSKELKIFQQQGFIFVSLGDNILRTETAAVVVASIFNYISGIYNE